MSLPTLRDADTSSGRVTNADDTEPRQDDGLLHENLQLELLATSNIGAASDTSRGPDTTSVTALGDPSEGPAPEKHSETCALCGLKASRWSGVTEWLVDGKWIGFCGNEHKNAWLRGERALS